MRLHQHVLFVVYRLLSITVQHIIVFIVYIIISDYYYRSCIRFFLTKSLLLEEFVFFPQDRQVHETAVNHSPYKRDSIGSSSPSTTVGVRTFGEKLYQAQSIRVRVLEVQRYESVRASIIRA
jgi:hypothetical protein